MPRLNRCGPGRAPEPSPAATAPPNRRGDCPRLPETPPKAPRRCARDGESFRKGGGQCHRKPLVRSVAAAAAAARRAVGGVFLLLAGALGPLEGAEAQTVVREATPTAGTSSSGNQAGLGNLGDAIEGSHGRLSDLEFTYKFATDTAGDPAEASTTLPAVAKGVRTPVRLNLDTIAGDDTVNIAEKAAGFTISGTTGSEAGVTVRVTIGSQPPLTATSDASGIWWVNVPANSTFITESRVTVTVGATKAGVTSPSVVTRPLAVDLTAPSVSYMAPATLKVGVFTAVALRAPDTDIAWYRATGLPSGLSIPAGVVVGIIFGMPDTADPDPASATVTVTDTAGNRTDVVIGFPAVAKGDQTLVDFSYSPHTVTFGDSAPTVMEPIALRPYLDYFDYLEQGASFFEQGPFFIRGRVQTGLSYSAAPSDVCTVDLSTGALTLLAVGECEVTATAAGTANYNDATATFTVTVQPGDTVALRLDDIAGDNAVNIAEKAAGFTISGNTGSEGSVSVTVTVGTTELTATSSNATPATWSVNVPANAAYITGTSVAVTVSATKTGFTSPSDVTRTLAVDLTAPAASYTAPAALKVGVAIGAMTPSTSDTDITSYRAQRACPRG